MRVSHWLVLIAIVVGLGCLQVAQHNAILLTGYAIGRRIKDVHEQQANLSWLRTQVVGLTSPTHLARVAHERRLKLVAWSTISPEHPVRVAAAHAIFSKAGDDNAD